MDAPPAGDAVIRRLVLYYAGRPGDEKRTTRELLEWIPAQALHAWLLAEQIALQTRGDSRVQR